MKQAMKIVKAQKMLWNVQLKQYRPTETCAISFLFTVQENVRFLSEFDSYCAMR